MTRRLLGDTVVDVAFGALRAAAGMPSLTLQRVAITLPIEVALHRAAGTWQVLGDTPRTVTRTAFDSPPGTLEVIWTMVEPA